MGFKMENVVDVVGQNKGNHYQNNHSNNQNEKLDPYTTQVMIYRAEMYIPMKYPYLIDLNSKHQSLSKTLDNKSHFFIIKSFSEEDVHKAIKYNVWTSTKSGNQTLHSAYQMAEEKGGQVYLLFSCNGSGRFVGLAQMKSEVSFNQFFPYWTQDNKWGGLFQIEWVFIKDIPFRLFRGIDITMRDGETKPVTNSRDTQEVPSEHGINMVDIIENYVHTNTILEHFEYYDTRQDYYEKSNPGRNDM